MQIGLLQTGHLPDEMRDETGDYDRLFDRLLTPEGLELTTWNVVDMEFPKSVHDRPGWLITGSRHGVYEDLPFIAPLEDFIRQAYAANVPLVGICFGHQIIAQALGGRVDKFSGGWSVGRQTYGWDDASTALNAWHQDQVIEPPAEAKVLSGNDFCENAALIYGEKAFSVQTHPEFSPAEIALLLKHRAPGVVPADRMAQAAQALDLPVDNAAFAKKIAQFFKSRRLDA